jgi:hypothetical protein
MKVRSLPGVLDILTQTRYNAPMSDYDNELNERMARILTATADALHGGPHPGGLHSWHDLPELVEKLRAERDEARREVCELSVKSEYQKNYAVGRGWDCYKDNP